MKPLPSLFHLPTFSPSLLPAFSLSFLPPSCLPPLPPLRLEKMLFYLTIGAVALLLILALALHYLGDLFSEFDGQFIYIVGGVFVVILGAGIFLTYAVPSLANSLHLGTGSNADTQVTQDTMVGMPLIEEPIPLDQVTN